MNAVRRLLAGAVAAGVLAGCMPAHRPMPALAKVDIRATWREPHSGAAAVETHWWNGFGDPVMGALIDRALMRNTDVLVSMARVVEARALAQVADSTRLPALNAGIGIGAGRSLGPTGFTNHRSIQPELQASWELDLWGKLRAQSRAAALQYQASQAERDGVALAVAAGTARAYIALLAFDAQLEITRGTASARAEALRLATDQARVGYISQLQLTQAQSEHEAVLQAIPQLELAVRRQENALRVLVGEAPGAVAPKTTLDALQLPALPAAIPSQLLVRRPDVVQRELALAATDALIDARRAAFMPQVGLSASTGVLLTNGLDYSPEAVWSLGGSILAPIFNAGRNGAQVDAATAQRNQAAYAYRGTVLAALGEVETGLHAVARLQEQMEHSQQRRAVLTRTLDFARDRYQAGYAPYLEVLDAQRALYQVQLDAVTLRQNQLNNYIDLYKALGGGWVR